MGLVCWLGFVALVWGFSWCSYFCLHFFLCGKSGNFCHYRQNIMLHYHISATSKVEGSKKTADKNVQKQSSRPRAEFQPVSSSVLCALKSSITKAVSLKGLQSTLYILLHKRKAFSATLSLSKRNIIYIHLILANKQRWEMAAAQVCWTANAAEQEKEKPGKQWIKWAKKSLPISLLFCRAAQSSSISHLIPCSPQGTSSTIFLFYLTFFKRVHMNWYFQNGPKMISPANKEIHYMESNKRSAILVSWAAQHTKNIIV